LFNGFFLFDSTGFSFILLFIIFFKDDSIFFLTKDLDVFLLEALVVVFFAFIKNKYNKKVKF